MKMGNRTSKVVVLQAVIVALSACGSARTPREGAPAVDVDAGADPRDDATDPLILTSDHPGYRQPLCFGCHGQIAPFPHVDAGYQPPACASCHGYNGAPHTDHATLENPGCPDCHSTVVHVPSFHAPDDCVHCHFHPEVP